MSASQLTLRIAFSSLRGMTVTLARELLQLCGSEAQFFAMEERHLRQLTQSKAGIYSAEYRQRKLALAEAEELYIHANKVRPLYFTDHDYPANLLDCEDAPLMLYAIGSCNLNQARCLAIVGTRHATAYGQEFTRRLVDDLSRKVSNLVIVSGLAYGVDIAAHRAALAAGVPTVAVMATGSNSIYPADHRSTAIDMVRQGGMLLTEYGSEAAVHKGNFVARNRIVAGMCDCLLVVESAAKGGALITANLAVGYNRDVFALPGRVNDRYSDGCNRLIACGAAQLITGANDLCAAMRWPVIDAPSPSSPTLPMPLNNDEALIVNTLDKLDEASLSQLSAATGFAVSKLMSTLIDMEFRNLVISLPGARYRKP